MEVESAPSEDVIRRLRYVEGQIGGGSGWSSRARRDQRTPTHERLSIEPGEEGVFGEQL